MYQGTSAVRSHCSIRCIAILLRCTGRRLKRSYTRHTRIPLLGTHPDVRIHDEVANENATPLLPTSVLFLFSKESDEDDTNHRILQTCPIFHSHTFTHRGRTLGVRTSGHCFSPALGRYQIKGDILVTPERCDVESIPPVPVGQFDISTEFDQDLDFFETAY